MADSLASSAATGTFTIEIASQIDRETEAVLEVRALDETQQAQVTISLGALGANEARAFTIPLASIGLRRASLRVGGALTLMPKLRDTDGLLTPRQDGPLVVGYHFEGPTLRVYDVATRTLAFAGGRLDGTPNDGVILSPARVVPRAAPVPGEDDGEPDPDHALAMEAP
ncbi:MAG: hypothetical protein HYS27_08370 [Deltaproteobacteria bacterium]|nr:hypothetical protein [Deltaproteobacteria bacterium]